MSRRTEPLLAWLRDRIKAKGLNTAALARAGGLNRAQLRRALTGQDPMTIDELMAIGEALELSPSDMGLPADTEPAEPIEAPPAPAEPAPADPWGNHTEQLFKIAFALGCDFYFLSDCRELDGSGVPEPVLQQYLQREPPNLPIQLDAAYHEHNEPKYAEHAVTLTLSFGNSIHVCTFPWGSISQVAFFPAAPPEATPDEPQRPHLRLVT